MVIIICMLSIWYTVCVLSTALDKIGYGMCSLNRTWQVCSK